MKNKMSIRIKMISGFLVVSFLVLAAGVLGVNSINWLKRESNHVSIVNAPLGDAAMEIKLNMTMGHLWLEEALGGDTSVDINHVWALFNQGLWYCNAMLGDYSQIDGVTGRDDSGTFITNDEGTFYAVHDEIVHSKLKDLQSNLLLFIKSANQRWEYYSGSDVAGSEVDQSFDRLYNTIQNNLKTVVLRIPEAAIRAGEARYLLANGHLFFEELLSGDTENEMEDILGQFNQAAKLISQFSTLLGSVESNQLNGDIKEFIKITNIRSNSVDSNRAAGNEADRSFDEGFEQVLETSDEVEEIIHDFMDDGLVQMILAAKTGTGVLLSSIAVSFVLAILLGILLSGGIAKPLNGISDSLNSSTLQIASAASQLSNTSQDIANGASEQASSIEETTASMEELGAMVRQNVENAKQMNILAIKSSESSETGSQKMDDLLSSMEELNSSSDEIKKIIKVIDGIAFQTNILALNAAVEAARAGEAGLGFAVVADEVKNLANKSADAAQETSELIEDSLKKIGHGLDISRGMSALFQEILTNGQKVTEMSKEVETASTQQDIGIGQINEVVVQLDKVVQSNASAAEESASSAEELSAQSETLRLIVQQLVRTITGKAGVQNIANNAYLAQPVKKKRTQLVTGQSENRVQLYDRSHSEQIISPEEMIPFAEDEEFASL